MTCRWIRYCVIPKNEAVRHDNAKYRAYGKSMTKSCRTCRETKPKTDFYTKGRVCKACVKARPTPSRAGRRSEAAITCSGCGVEKPGTEYHKNSIRCVVCYRKQGQEHHRRNRDSRRLQMRSRLYGLTPEQILAMGNRCAICGGTSTAKSRSGSIESLCVDHCHRSGTVRALLCRACNHMIGHARESPDLLRKAADYIEQHSKGKEK